MNNVEEGHIKFNCQWNKTGIVIPSALFAKINPARNVMIGKKLIGIYPDGTGYGNISIRCISDSSKFFITGSSTGEIKVGTPEIYSLVEKWDITENTLICSGPVKASSESLSHAAIYESLPKVETVLHIHDLKMWLTAMSCLPSTPEDVKYGTPELAYSIKELIIEEGFVTKGIFAMKGHKEGIVSFGSSTGEALELLNTIC